VSCYDRVLKDLLDKHAPMQTRALAQRTTQPWMTDEIADAKKARRRSEVCYKKCQSVENRKVYKRHCELVKQLIVTAKSTYFVQKIDDCKNDQKKLFQIVDKLLGRGKSLSLPEHDSVNTLVQTFNDFFITKISNIRSILEDMEKSIQDFQCPPLDSMLIPCQSKLQNLAATSPEEISSIVMKSSKTSCALDPIPTSLLRDLLPVLAPIIANLVNSALSSGKFPSDHKSAIVQPLLKKPTLDPEILKNYRPVSNLSFISKVIEKVIAARLLDHMTKNNMMDPYQSAYRKGHSTETALVRVHNDIVTAVDKGFGVCLILLDLSAAFDTVDHAVLLSFLKNHIGLGGHALDLLESYLSGRTQCVSINGVLSELKDLAYGVPQGSVLGPIEFCIYTIPLGAILNHYGMSYHIYADDTQIYCSFKINSLDEVLNSISACIADIRSWMIVNKLKINDDKTEFLLVTSPHSKLTSDIQISIGQERIAPSSSCKSLGVVFDQHFSMANQVKNICRSVHFHIRNIKSIRNLLPSTAAAQIMHSLVSSRLDYCNALLHRLPACRIKPLQRMQNIAARVIAMKSRKDDAKPILKKLHWLPVNERILFKVLLLVYKCKHGLAPKYLQSLCVPYQKPYNSRNNYLDKLDPPKSRLVSYGDRSFVVAGAEEWNKLPLVLKQSPSVECFKKNLKTYLFEMCFN
jgi:hypothetical protein